MINCHIFQNIQVYSLKKYIFSLLQLLLCFKEYSQKIHILSSSCCYIPKNILQKIYFLSSSCCSSSGTRLESRPPSTRNSSSSYFGIKYLIFYVNKVFDFFKQQNIFLRQQNMSFNHQNMLFLLSRSQTFETLFFMQYFSDMPSQIQLEQLEDFLSFLFLFCFFSPYICLSDPPGSMSVMGQSAAAGSTATRHSLTSRLGP